MQPPRYSWILFSIVFYMEDFVFNPLDSRICLERKTFKTEVRKERLLQTGYWCASSSISQGKSLTVLVILFSLLQFINGKKTLKLNFKQHVKQYASLYCRVRKFVNLTDDWMKGCVHINARVRAQCAPENTQTSSRLTKAEQFLWCFICLLCF